MNAYVKRGLTYEDMGRMDLARADYEKALSLPARHDSWAHEKARERLSLMTGDLATCEKKRGREALAACTRFLQQVTSEKDGKRRARAYFFRSKLHIDRKVLDEALADLKQAIRLDPQWAGKVADIWPAPEKAKDVLRMLEELTIARPSDPLAWQALADFQKRLKKYDAAIRNYRRAVSLSQNAREKRDRLVNLGHVYLSKEDAKGLLATVQEILKITPLKPDLHALYHRALALEIQGNMPEARKQLREILRLVKERPDAFEAAKFEKLAAEKLAELPRHWRAVRLFKAGKFEQALARINDFLEKNPNDIEALRFRARLFEKLGQPEKALADYEQITILRPQDAGAWRHLAEAFHRMGKIEQAMRNISRAVALEPENAVFLNERAWLQVLSGRGGKALADIEKALKIAPDYAPAIDTHAHVLVALGREDEARAAFERGFAKGVRSAYSYLAYARLLLKTGEKEKARKYLRKAADFRGRLWEDRKAVAEARALLQQLEKEAPASPAPASAVKAETAMPKTARPESAPASSQ